MELTKVKLSDIARVEISGVDKKSKPGQKSVRLCNFVDVYHNWAITQDMRDSFMEATASDKEIEALSIKKGQVAFTKDSETRDDIGIPTYIADDFDDVVLGYHNALITPDERKLNGKYLNAFMHSSYIQKYFENNASGSGQRYTLSNDTVNSIPILLPSIKEQEKIGNLFSFIDRKIALNKKMNQKFETMAKRLYDYWFVQFDFPDKNGRPYKTTGGSMTYNQILKREIPVGWEIKKLEECINLFDSKRIPLSSQQRASKKGVIPYYGATGIMDYVDDFIYDGEYILLAEDGSVETDDGFVIIQRIWGKTWVNNHAHVIQPKENGQYEFYYQVLSSIVAKKITTGSIQKKISQENMNAYKLLSPPKDLVLRYSLLVHDSWEKQKKIVEENVKLQNLRDKLLPLLMNGQVTIA